ncbi:MAG: SPFH domain-containing protein [Clostridia bacterium]|nr:SPFH domain-containing protein [Clostridia bacterium]
MGLIKAAVGAVGSTLHDQWKEAIRCEDLGNDILMKKVTTSNGVISNGSTVIVGPGQCAIIYDNGRIVDASAEEGVYTFDSSSTPSLFAGQFGETFKEMWQRFTYNGATAKQQAVFFFNIKEITDNGFGTSTPVPYKDWGHPLMNARTNSYIGMSVKIKCYGKYTFRISDPFTFMSTFAGTADVYRKNQLVEQIRTEVVASFINVLNALCTDKYKVEALEIPSKTLEIKKLMEENDFDKDIKNRGVSLVTFNVEGVSLDDESNKKIDQYEIGGDAYQQQGSIVEAYSEAIPEAAKNPNGSLNGFMGVGVMNMTSGGMFTGAQNNAFAAKPMDPQSATKVEAPKAEEKKDTWMCPNCQKEVDGKFCSECGAKKPEKKFCTQCGKELKETCKFCPECGNPVEK